MYILYFVYIHTNTYISPTQAAVIPFCVHACAYNIIITATQTTIFVSSRKDGSSTAEFTSLHRGTRSLGEGHLDRTTACGGGRACLRIMLISFLRRCGRRKESLMERAFSRSAHPARAVPCYHDPGPFIYYYICAPTAI